MEKPAVTVVRPGARHLLLPPDPGAAFPACGPGTEARQEGRAPRAPGDTRADDATLIELSRTDPEAFGAIFGRHATEIHRFAARRLGDGLAEDVVGEVFLVAFRSRARYDLGYRDARPWLYGIAANVIRCYRRAEIRAYQALARTGADPVTAMPDDDALARVAASARRRELAAALARLSADDRDTLLLIAWAGLSYEETARAMGVPVGTVRSRMSRARRKLRRALGGCGPTEAGQTPAVNQCERGEPGHE